MLEAGGWSLRPAEGWRLKSAGGWSLRPAGCWRLEAGAYGLEPKAS
jgi:hypothetical protein